MVSGAVVSLGLLSIAVSTVCTAAETVPDAATGDAAGSDDVIRVTARRQSESILDVPVAVTSLPSETIDDLNLRAFVDYAALVPNLSFAYGNGTTAGNSGAAIADARTIAIRGIAGPRTTGYYLDDTPLPGVVDVRVVDVHDIEVVKGPQGTLYGESSMGGNVQMTSKLPLLNRYEASLSTAAGVTDHSNALDSSARTIGNLVLEPGTAALRVVAFAENQAGDLTRTFQSNINDPNSPRRSVGNQGDQSNQGGSATLRLVDGSWDILLRWLAQDTHDHGFPATYAPLPAFKPISTIDHLADVQPTVDDNWTLPILAFTYSGTAWSLHSSTSYFDRHTRDVEDSTEGTAQVIGSFIGTTLAPQPYVWTVDHHYAQISHETRVQLELSPALNGTLGLFYSRNRLDFAIPDTLGQGLAAAALWPTDLLWVQHERNTQTDMALFGEFYYRMIHHLALTAGVRQFWLRQADNLSWDGLLGGGPLASATTNRESGTSPRLALTYQPDRDAMVYASVSKGFRAGGAQFPITVPECAPDLAAIGQTGQSVAHIASDNLWNYELGGKYAFDQSRLIVTAAAFHIDWKRIQQSIFLPHCGFYTEGNAGAAAIDGGELEMAGHINGSTQLRLGVGYENARITAAGGTGQVAGSRIYQTPRWTASVAAVHTESLTDTMKWFAAADANYTGNSVSSNSGVGLNLVRPAYVLGNARLGLSWQQSELALSVNNIGNVQPNLGDLLYVGYERYEPGTSTPMPQVATLPRRTVMLGYTWRY
jgi:outer membrane receptor protein involved in Fe transport